MRKDIAKIERTMLGYEDHGILSCMLHVTYGSSGQGVGGYCLDTPIRDADDNFVCRMGTAYGMEFVARVIRACGVDTWEQIKGRTIYVLQDLEEGAPAWGTSRVVGIENLPTERGERFIFADLRDEFEDDGSPKLASR
jgi:3D (Asp-Asp-Asp) domain-containing protein